MGRPEKFKDEYVKIVEGACKLGATDQEIADMLAVCIRTIAYWRATKPEFAAALKVGKEAADDRVERSLFAKANGYSYDAVKIFLHEGQVVEAPYREHVPPSDTAAIFWLKNRRKKEWRDRHEVTGLDGGPISTVTVSLISTDPQEAAREYQRLMTGDKD